MSLTSIKGFDFGDLIEVTPLERQKGGPDDFGVLRGTALSELRTVGIARFNMVAVIGSTKTELTLNCNDVDVRLLFSAKIARARS